MAAERAQPRVAANLAADVVGYTCLIQQDEADMLGALKARRSEVLQPAVSKHRGRFIKLMGDGVLIEFASRGRGRMRYPAAGGHGERQCGLGG